MNTDARGQPSQLKKTLSQGEGMMRLLLWGAAMSRQ